MADYQEDHKWIVGYLDKENILEDAFTYPTRTRAEEEFYFEPDEDTGSFPGIRFLAKIIRKQVIQKVEKYQITVEDVEKGKIISETETSITCHREED